MEEDTGVDRNMNIKKILKRIFQKEIKEPVYIPLLHGELLVGRNILITGGSGGIGFSIAEACIRNGASVVISGRNKNKLDVACEKLRERIINPQLQHVYAVEFDVCDVECMEENLNKVIKMFNTEKIDTLINNAGVLRGESIGKTEEKDYEIVMNTNMKGTYFVSQYFSNYLIENEISGNILNISSSSAIRPATSPYIISKWGERGLTLGLAKKLIPYGIVVNAIAPGPTATEMLMGKNQNLKHYTSPSGRYLVPEEIANLAVFLVSNMGRMVVGDTVYITGGCANLTIDDMEY